jgi:chemotaxis protein methyltransferase CheR
MTVAPTDFEYISTMVRERSAIVLEHGKEYLIEARLLPLARTRGTATVAELVHELRREPTGPLRDLVVEAMTTNETSFFRDAHPFTALSDRILPDLVRARSGERQLSIWCAACSSGQEPYSVAMLVHDIIGADPSWRVRLLATDLSPAMLARTRAGRYTQFEVNRGLPANFLVRHFRKQGLEWQIEEPIRRMVETRLVNLDLELAGIPPMDIIFMRNVLIYFDMPTKKELLRRVRESLRDDGYFFLGGAETTMGIDPQLVSMKASNASMVYQHAKAAALATG